MLWVCQALIAINIQKLKGPLLQYLLVIPAFILGRAYVKQLQADQTEVVAR